MKKQNWIVKFINKVDLPWGLSKEQLEELRKEAEQLTSENARLTEQFENAVVLPCKVGDALYFLREAKYKNPYNLNIETCKVEKLILTEKGWRIKLDANSMYETSIKALGTTLFTTKEAAKARLKELKGDE